MSNSSSQVSTMTGSLVLAANDKEEGVRDVIVQSLTSLGIKQHAVVLATIRNFLNNHPKLNQDHRVILLVVMNKIIKQTLTEEEFSSSLARDVIQLASADMTNSKKVIPEWQTAASDILVTMGTVFVNEVMEEMLSKFQPGSVPHFFVLQTIGNLSVANVMHMVPYLKHLLSATLPILGQAKHDNIRWVLATSLFHYSEAILEYLANISSAPDTTITQHTFANEIFGAFDVLFNVWLLSKEVKLRCAAVEALGKMSRLLEIEKLQEHFPRLILAVINLYKRQPNETYSVTKALCDIITACGQSHRQIPESIVDPLVNALHSQICLLAGVDNLNVIGTKNYNEILRCFGLLADGQCELLVNFCLTKVESRDDRIRVGSLAVLRHLINSASERLQSMKDVIVIGLTKLLNETHEVVKVHFIMLISSMATHGFLMHEGGHRFIDFLVKQSSFGPDNKTTSNNNVAMMSDNALYLITTTVEGMDTVLWPYMFGFLVSPMNTHAISIVSRCLAHIASDKRESNASDYAIDFVQQVNIPSSFALVSRLLVVLSDVERPRFHADKVLDLLIDIGPVLHNNITSIWDKEIPTLHKYLKNKDEFDQETWDWMILKVLSLTIEAVADDEWTCALATELCAQWLLYTDMSHCKKFSLQGFGTILRLTSNRQFVETSLAHAFQSTKHAVLAEREGLGLCFGYTSSVHLDLCLECVQHFYKTQVAKKESSLFGGFFKSEKANSDVEHLKGSIALCSGQAAYFAHVELVQSRVEGDIAKTTISLFKSNKDISVKCNILDACELIAKSLHPEHFNHHPLHPASTSFASSTSSKKKNPLSARGDIINHILVYMKDDVLGKPSKLKCLAMQALDHLIKLDPLLNDADVFQLVKTCTDNCIVLTPSDNDDEKMQNELLSCMNALHCLLSDLIVKCPTPGGLNAIFKHLHGWLTSDKEHERIRSLQAIETILSVYYAEFAVSKTNSSLTNMGEMLSRLIARCCDPAPKLRIPALKCVSILLKVQAKYNGVRFPDDDSAFEELSRLSDKLSSEEPHEMYDAMKEVAKITVKKLPNEMTFYVDGSVTHVLMSMIVETHVTCANAVCLTLHHIFKTRGNAFAKQVNQIVEAIHVALKVVTDGHTRNGTLRLISLLAIHHLQATVHSLLAYQLPYTEQITSCWRHLGGDKNLFDPVIEMLLDMLSRGMPFDQKSKKKKNEKTATVNMLAVSCALCQMMDQSQEIPFKQSSGTASPSGFPRTFTVCLVRVGSMRKTIPPEKLKIDPFRQAIDTLYCLVSRSCSRDMSKFLEERLMWNHLESDDDEKFIEAISILTKALVRYRGSVVGEIVSCLNVFLASIYDEQRIIVIAVFAQLIVELKSQNEILLDLIMDNIRSRLVDSNNMVRRLCIRGLANIVNASSDHVSRYSTSVLSALMSGMDDKNDVDDVIVLEAMTGLERFLNEVENVNIDNIFINICLRIRPCFEKENPAVRSTAIRLFASLERFGIGQSEAAFKEQAHSNFIPILLHLNDTDVVVRNACIMTLHKVGHVLGSDNANSMLHRVLKVDSNLHYGEFMNDFSKIMISDLSGKVNHYVMSCVSFFKSQWAIIRSNAVMLAGFLLANLSEGADTDIAKEHICQAIIQLLKDSSPNVRAKAAEALSLLHRY